MPRNPKGFSRVDSKTTNAHGWLVRIKRGELRKSRFISDSTHGGKRKSMAVAQKVYEEWTAELPEPDTSVGKLSARNNTGVVGVHFSHDTDERFPGCEYESFIASWLTEDGRRAKIGFSCNRYGHNEAFALACTAREMHSTDRAKVVAQYEKKGMPESAKAAGNKPKKAAKAALTRKGTAKKSVKKSVKKSTKKKVATPKKSTKKVAKKSVKKVAKKASPAKKAKKSARKK